MAAVSNSNRDEIRRLLKVIQDNTTAGDWSNNLFVGVVYFLMGDNDEGIMCVEENIDFGYEDTVSQAILAEMKKGKLDAFTLYALKDDLKELIEKSQKPQPQQARGQEVKPTQQAEQKKPSKRRDLTREEIVLITEKHGFVSDDHEWKKDGKTRHVLSYYDNNTYFGAFLNGLTYGLRTTYYLMCCDDGLYWCAWNIVSLLYKEESFMSYDDLRNDPKVTHTYLQELFEDFPSEVVQTLMELKELD